MIAVYGIIKGNNREMKDKKRNRDRCSKRNIAPIRDSPIFIPYSCPLSFFPGFIMRIVR
jgi:hypothetical protein